MRTSNTVYLMTKKVMRKSKEINYFETPEDRRKGRVGMANLMEAVLNDRAERLQTNQKNNDSDNRKNQ